MLSISMAYNVISYKKIKRNTKKIKIADLTSYIDSAPDFRNDQILPNSRVAESGFTQFLHRYGIYWMVNGESSCPGGSEYVWQRGEEGVSG